MKTLSTEAYAKARGFVLSQARPLDKALFRFYFEDGPAQDGVRALEIYQNDDGGFGHALEPDFRLDVSSPLATSVAFQYLMAVGATHADPLVQRGISYFVTTHNDGWQSVPPAIDEVPRAFWWNYNADKPWGNPDAEIVGYLNAFAEHVPTDLLQNVTKRAVSELERRGQAMEMHLFLCFLRMSVHVPQILPRLLDVAPTLVATDPAQWAEYGLQPWWVMESSDSPFMAILGDAMHTNLDYLIEQQAEDGAWHPPWSWGRYEDVWPQAEREWCGHLTVRILKVMKNFGRMEV